MFRPENRNLRQVGPNLRMSMPVRREEFSFSKHSGLAKQFALRQAQGTLAKSLFLL